MISSTHTEDGTPIGRRFLQKWSRSKISGGNRRRQRNARIPADLGEVEMEDTGDDNEFWKQFPDEDGTVSELYVLNDTVVWSKNGKVIKVFKGSLNSN